MSAKDETPNPSVGSNKSARANKTEPQFEVTCKFRVPANDEQLRDVLNGPKWKYLVRTILHTLQDWRDCTEGQEYRAYDNAIQFLRYEMASIGLTLAYPHLIEEGHRRSHAFFAQRIAKRNQAAERTASFSGSNSGAQVEKLVSSGETEAEKTALDFAIDNGLAHGGSCRQGKPSEEGPLDERYRLTETPDANTPHVVERNIADSDATVVITPGLEFRGLTRIARLATKHRKPWLHVSGFAAGENAAPMFQHFLEETRAKVLNVLAPSSSHQPDAPDLVRKLLSKALLPSEPPNKL